MGSVLHGVVVMEVFGVCACIVGLLWRPLRTLLYRLRSSKVTPSSFYCVLLIRFSQFIYRSSRSVPVDMRSIPDEMVTIMRNSSFGCPFQLIGSFRHSYRWPNPAIAFIFRYSLGGSGRPAM